MVTQTQPVEHSRTIERSPVFYGWVVWAVAMLGIIATAPGQSYSVSLFIDAYIAEFYHTTGIADGVVGRLYGADVLMLGSGMGRTIVSTLFGAGTFIAALSLTQIGTLIDRYGNRPAGTVIAALFALVLVSLSLITGPLTIFLSFVAIRFLGQGSMFLVSTTAIAKWWRVKRGWMMGLALVGFALFQRVYLPLLENLISTYGWRQTWVILGVVMGVVVVPVWWLLMRNTPESYGMQPDSVIRESDVPAPVDDEENWTLPETRRLPIFWVFLFGRMIAGAWGTGLVFHQVSIFAQVGHSRVVTAATFGTIALVNAVVTFGFGRYVSRVRPGLVMGFQLAVMIFALLWTQTMTEQWMLTVYAVSFGIVMALGGSFDGTVWADLFGRLHHGAIRGFVTTFFIAGTSAGPILFGYSFDAYGSYTPVIYLGVGLICLPLIGSLTMRKPRRRDAG